MSAQVIGYLGENGVRDVRIPIGHLLDKWQGLRPLLVMVPVGGSDDEAYPVQYTLDGTDLVWHVSDADTAVAGTTKAAVRMVDDGGRVGMDEPFQVIISPNLSAGGEPPVVIKPWVDKLATLVPRAESAAERAENAAQNWEAGTAPNALALGDKAPEYYLPVQNLLVNPDFAIAQAGYGGWHGNVMYAADRWSSDADLQFAHDGNGLTIKNTGTTWYRSIRQKVLLKNPAGKTYTLAVTCNTTNSIRLTMAKFESTSFIASSFYNGTGSDSVFVLVAKIPSDYTERGVTVTLAPDCDSSGNNVNALQMRLYEGEYTADSLPPFMPPDHTLELAKCQRVLMPVPTDAILTGFSGSSGAINLFVPCPYMSPTATPTVINGDGVDIVVVGNNIFQTCTDWTVNKYADGGVRITTPTTLSTFKTAVSGYVNTTNTRMFISCEP